MSDQLSVLPVELIDRILDEIPTFDILTHVCFVNKRLRAISLNYPRFRFDLNRSFDKKRQFDEHCTQLVHLSSQVVSLTLANDGDATMPVRIAYFLSQFMALDAPFSNLRSLSLSHVDLGVWQSLKVLRSSFFALNSISISLIKREKYLTTLFVSTTLVELLSFSSSLQHLSLRAHNCLSDRVTIDPGQALTTSSITHLTLDNIDADLQTLLPVTPLLRSFISTAYYSQIVHNIHLLPAVYLQRLSINVEGIRLTKIERLLSSMKHLTDFTLIAYNVDKEWADGGKWARMLTRISTFKFKFTFHSFAFREESFDLQSFQTSFWLLEKKWYVTFDSVTEYCHPLLYSHPYCLEWYPFYQMKGTFVTKSTSPEPSPILHVIELDVGDWLSLSNVLRRRCTYVDVLNIFPVRLESSLNWRDLIMELNTSTITCVSIDSIEITTSIDATVQLLSSLPSVRSMRVSVTILKMLLPYDWSRITRLHIVWGSDRLPKFFDHNQVDSLCRSFTSIQHLDFTRSFIDDVGQLLNNMMMTLTHVYIDHSTSMTADDDRFISHQWLQRNTKLRNFHYSCDQRNTVRLWL